MRTGISPIIVALLPMIQLSSCQEIETRNYRLAVEVQDPDGNPVSDVRVITGKLVPVNEGVSIPANTITIESDAANAEGAIRLEYKSLPEPDGNASVYGAGYYTSSYTFGWNSPEGGSGAARFAEIKATLKPVRNPIPMIARNDLRIRTPEFGVPYGFDLEIGQALPPFGDGEVADVQFVLSGTRRDLPGTEKEAINFRTEIRCPNEGDGFIEFLAEDTKEFSKGAALVSSNEAPAEGYAPLVVRIATTDPDGNMGNIYNVNNVDGKKCCYFRVRTRKDDSGNIVSAHYGKMYGPLEIRPAYKQYGNDVSKGQGGFFIQYLYFNPTPNDLNVEFDPRHNLNPNGNVPHP